MTKIFHFFLLNLIIFVPSIGICSQNKLNLENINSFDDYSENYGIYMLRFVGDEIGNDYTYLLSDLKPEIKLKSNKCYIFKIKYLKYNKFSRNFTIKLIDGNKRDGIIMIQKRSNVLKCRTTSSELILKIPDIAEIISPSGESIPIIHPINNSSTENRIYNYQVSNNIAYNYSLILVVLFVIPVTYFQADHATFSASFIDPSISFRSCLVNFHSNGLAMVS